MKLERVSLEGAFLITPDLIRDERGFFFESYQEMRYQELGIETPFVQENHSFSKRGTIRGMHYQSTPGQAKLIRVAVGKIWDVIVDIRRDSKTFGQWEGVLLDDLLHQQLYIPVGFAHGFCVLSESAHVLYKVSTPYDPKTEKGFRYDDPKVGIKWPMKGALISKRDQQSPYFHEAFHS